MKLRKKEVFHSIDDCAMMLGINRNLIRKEIEKGNIKASKIGDKKFKIKHSSFKSYVKSREVKVKKNDDNDK